MAGPEPNLRDLFGEALQWRTPGEQSAYLAQACQGDVQLKARLEELLQAHREAGSFLREPSASRAATIDLPTPAEAPGAVIGPYKLLELIGEGGFGVVFLAEQTEPVRRKVALKILKPGMDTRQVVARFEAERQALAIMDHPNIAKVFDGGATASGRPYFVMELVKGVPITDFCDQNQLTPLQRLELFLPVCQAVQHAHQKGIIHRDLKPSNVLVSRHDTTPIVKVIDFGVAKALGQELTDKTLHTGIAQMVGTPHYMSPEQAGMSDLDVDTRSDIYSLGVLLYELLTGTTPFDKERFKSIGYDEMRRIIREEEPARPSTRLSTLGAAATTVSANRGSEPRRLTALVRGELDWIVMKALEKDRNRRYESANAFAADVQRHLAGEAVLAVPPSAGYRVRKFVRRNKRALATMALLGLMLMALVGAVTGSIGWMVREEATRAAQVKHEVDVILTEARELSANGKWLAARAAIERAQVLLAGKGANDEQRQQAEELLKDLRMAERLESIRLQRPAIVGRRFDSAESDSDYATAFRDYGIDVEALAANEAGEQIRPRAIQTELIAALDDWAMVRRGRPAPARFGWEHLLAVAQQAELDSWRNQLRFALARGELETLKELAASPEVDKLRDPTLVHLAGALKQLGAVSDAVILLRHAQRKRSGDLWINHQLGSCLMDLTPPRPDEAIQYYMAAVALRPTSPGARVNLGLALDAKGAQNEAIAAYRDALDLDPHCVEAHGNLGNALAVTGQLDKAIDAIHEALRLEPNSAVSYYSLGKVFNAQRRNDASIAAYETAIRLKQDFAEAHTNLGIGLSAKGLPDEAIDHYREALRHKHYLPQAHLNLGLELEAKGEARAAMDAYRNALRHKPDHPYRDYAEPYYRLAHKLQVNKELGDAEAAYREAIRHDPDYAEAYCNLGLLLQKKDQFTDALEAVRRGHALGLKRPAWPHPSADWVRLLAWQADLDSRLPAVLSGAARAVDADDQVALASFCTGRKQLHANSARLYAEAFSARPELAESLEKAHRYNAACAAALAGCGLGKDADKLDGQQRAELRSQALAWLQADLKTWARLLDQEPGTAKSAVSAAQSLEHWLVDTDFAGVHRPEALGKLSEMERQAWQHLWDDVASLLARARAKTTLKK